MATKISSQQSQVLPKKIRELKNILRKASFAEKSGKGSHTKWTHPMLSGIIVLSGKDARDAKPYQEKDVEKSLKKLGDLEQ